MLRNIEVPTGNICVINGDKGPIEFLSIGDYGKNANIKADFLGITRELNGVPNSEIMPLSEKWVVTISTQYGCSQNCIFCDVPKVGKGINATYNDLTNQVIRALELHPDITYTKRLNLHYARMGEPSLNVNVLTHAINLKEIIKPYLGNSLVHPVVSTMLPNRNKHLKSFINEWVYIKNNKYNGDAGLQFSINSTDDSQRNHLFSNNSLSLKEISDIGNKIEMPKGRKYALNFALADYSIINANDLLSLFDPKKFMVKLTPLHQTKACEDNDIKTSNGYQSFTPYKEVEENLKQVGYDVIVFVPSYDEDLGLITCGNAILSGSVPKVKYIELRVK